MLKVEAAFLAVALRTEKVVGTARGPVPELMVETRVALLLHVVAIDWTQTWQCYALDGVVLST
eukprot:scaffold220_cov169-Amphora_coffeaeformis.AAC.30